MTPLPPSTNTSSSLPTGPQNPDYVDLGASDKAKERVNNKIPQGFAAFKGVVLTTDGLDVPLEAHGIQYDRTEQSRPTLMPLIRSRHVENRPIEFSPQNEYEELRRNLPESIRTKLEADEQLEFEDRDSDWIAFDESLRFEAARRAIIKQMGGPLLDTERALEAANRFTALPDTFRTNVLNTSIDLINRLDRHLAYIGPNDPSYDLLLNASNQIKETIRQLRQR